MPAPDPHRPPLGARRLTSPTDPWTQVEVLAQAGSTNAVVAARAREGATEGLVVVAEHQVEGRGRLDRRWETPARSALTVSVLLRPEAPAARWPWLPLLTGVAVADAVRRRAGLACTLKWPNDLLVDGRKVAGLLVERVETPHGPAAVVGIGVNVSTTADELPVPTAGSLALAGATGEGLDRTGLLLDVLTELGARYTSWHCAEGGDEALRAAYRERCVTLGQQVRVHLPGGAVRDGRAVDVEADGALRVRTAGGDLVVHSGDVVHVRPVG